MLEQDIELARLLVTRLEDLEQRAQFLHADMREARAELDAAEAVRTERASYLDVLSRAAELLERQDLTVPSPETTALENRVVEIQSQLDQLNAEAGTFRTLMHDLADLAPNLLAAARGEALLAEATETGVDNAGFALEDQPDALVADQVTEAPAPELESASDGESETVLQRFNVNNLKTKEVFTYGRGVVYIVDTESIMERVPSFDRQVRHLEENQIRDELVRDFDTLKRELSGSINLVFSTWYQTQQEYSNEITLEFANGEAENTRSACSQKIAELVQQHIGEQRNVCVITGDSELGEAMKDAGAYVLSLSEVFLA